MKLLNHTLLYLSVSLLSILSIWAVIFYFNMLGEVKSSIDDGLDNYKMLIIYKAQQDSVMLQSTSNNNNNYFIREVSPEYAAGVRDEFKDTLIYRPRTEAPEPLRLLTTAFVASNGRFYEMKILSSTIEKGQLIKTLLYSLIALYVMILASMVIVNNFVLQKIWRPFYHVLQQLNNFKLEGVPAFQSSKTKVREFQALNNSIQSLLKRNRETFDSQKQFIENASHELQTPLAISINKLELLADQPDRSPEDMLMIANILETLQGLTRLNRSLLLLSKIENRQFAADSGICLNDVMKKAVERFADLAAFREVKLLFNDEGEWIFPMNSDLAAILVTNLVKNAIIHNESGGEIVTKVGDGYIAVENTGAAMPLDSGKLFERFYKRSAESSSTGLGLAIIKAITDFYGLSIQYSYNGRHVFTLSR
jgi:signal transduction histidine kinase